MDLGLTVPEAGGLGSLPCALMDPESLRSALTTVRNASIPISVNFFAHRDPGPDGANNAAWFERMSAYYAELGRNRQQLFPRTWYAPSTAMPACLSRNSDPRS